MLELSHERTRLLRAQAQGIGGHWRAASVTAVLDQCFAVQAQHLPAAALGIRARGSGLTAADVHRALGPDRAVVRGWFMRGTLYLVAARDAGWLRELLAPQLLRRSERRYRELGLGPAELRRGERVITTALAADGPLTRDQLAARLAAAGLNATGQVPFHLIRRCALLGLVSSGPVRDGDASYALAGDGPPGPGGADAARELARRYLAAHGPAALRDFVTWSGLSLPAARTAWRELTDAGLAVPCRIAGLDAGDCVQPARDQPDAQPHGDVRLLPGYDNYLVGYADRRLSVPAAHERKVWPGGGQISATIVADGLACGTWRRDRSRGIAAELFDGAPDGIRAALDSERHAIARFVAAADITGR
jgi:hypothetical protein